MIKSATIGQTVVVTPPAIATQLNFPKWLRSSIQTAAIPIPIPPQNPSIEKNAMMRVIQRFPERMCWRLAKKRCDKPLIGGNVRAMVKTGQLRDLNAAELPQPSMSS